MKAIRTYLFFSGLFIIAVGLFYGAPKSVIESAFGLSIEDNALHIFRAIMGLYCGIGGIVLLGARYQAYTKFSLLLETIFFGGVGIGRLISILVDGNIHRVSMGASAFEILMFIVSLLILLTQNGKILRNQA